MLGSYLRHVCAGLPAASSSLHRSECPSLAVGPCWAAASPSRPVAPWRAPTACAACLVLCLLGILLPWEHGAVTLSGVWTRARARLTGTRHIKLLLLAFDCLLCDKAARDVAASSAFPGGMRAGNCIIAVEGSCVTVLAADDAVVPMCDMKGRCMSLLGGQCARFSLQGELGWAGLCSPCHHSPWRWQPEAPGLPDGCFLFSRLVSKSQPKQKRREDVGPKKR